MKDAIFTIGSEPRNRPERFYVVRKTETKAERAKRRAAERRAARVAELARGRFTVYAIHGAGGVYIGATSYPLSVRWSNHKSDARRGSRLPLHVAIREHGADAFVIERIAQFHTGEEAREGEYQATRAARRNGLRLFNTSPAGSGRLTAKPALAPAGAAPSSNIALHPLCDSGDAAPAGASPCTERA